MTLYDEPGRNSISGCHTDIAPEWVSWIQFDIGWEMRQPSGFALRISYGIASLLSSPDWRCTVQGKPVPCDSLNSQTVIPTFTVAMGYAF
jgi:hypothetical protein